MDLQIDAIGIKNKEELFKICNEKQNSLWVSEYIAKSIAFCKERQTGDYLKKLVRHFKENMDFIDFQQVFRESKLITKKIEKEASDIYTKEHEEQQAVYALMLKKVE